MRSSFEYTEKENSKNIFATYTSNEKVSLKVVLENEKNRAELGFEPRTLTLKDKALTK